MVTPHAADATNTTTLDGSTTSATLELFRAALGPLHTDYYLKAFTRFDAADRAGPSWNWAASLCTLNWMALRQLWGAALAYTGALLAAALLIFGIGRLVFQFSMDVQMGLLGVLGVLAFVLPGLFGNALLYADCRKKMEHALSVNATLEDACAMLKRAASSRQRLVGLGIGNILLLGAVFGGYAAFPAAQHVGAGPQPLGQARNAAVGKTLDLAAAPDVPAAPAAPASAASAPTARRSDPVISASAPLAVASAPTAAASNPVVAAAASAPFVSASSPLVVASAPAATASAAPAKPKTEPTKTAASKGKPASAPAAKNTKVVADISSRFIVNVGLFADENNTRNTYTKLNDAGLNVLSNEITTKKGKLTRIRVGPFATQAEADRAAEKIRRLKLDAVVVPQ